jgi:hypothetical protein
MVQEGVRIARHYETPHITDAVEIKRTDGRRNFIRTVCARYHDMAEESDFSFVHIATLGAEHCTAGSRAAGTQTGCNHVLGSAALAPGYVMSPKAARSYIAVEEVSIR